MICPTFDWLVDGLDDLRVVCGWIVWFVAGLWVVWLGCGWFVGGVEFYS